MSETLLEMTQDILASMSGEEISSISDTVESLSIAYIIRSCYKNLTSEDDFPEDEGLFELDASGDNTKPCLMTLPSNVTRLDWIRYNKDTTSSEGTIKYEDVDFLEPYVFVDKAISGRRTTDTNVVTQVESINNATVDLVLRNDKHPTYYTVLKNNRVIFDSYDSSVDTTLQKAKTMAYGAYISNFSIADSFVPFADRHSAAVLRNAARAQCWEDLKRFRNATAERQERRARLARDRKDGVAGRLRRPIFTLPDFGRR